MKYAWICEEGRNFRPHERAPNVNICHVCRPLLFVGPTGTGKTVYVQQKLMSDLSKDVYVPMFISFSARTTANHTQVLSSTCIIISSSPSPPHYFIRGLKPTFSAHRSHCSLPFLLPDWLHGFPGLFTDISEHICVLRFSFSVFPLFSCWFRAVDSALSCQLLRAR